MRLPRSIPRPLLAAFALVASAGASCAQGTLAVGLSSTGDAGGAAGTGGSGGAAGAGGIDGGSDAPIACLHQSDCAPLVDACNGGSCLNNVCVRVPANEGGACDDGLYCTDGDTCTMGVCAGMPKTCPGSDACHVGACDEPTKTCSIVPGNDGASCTPTDPCFPAGFCSSGTCVGSTPKNCSFLNDACNVGTCDMVKGCVKTPNNGVPCNDGSLCSTNKTCQNGACSGGTPVVCPPSITPCVASTCVEGFHTCQLGPVPDGTACTTNDPCFAQQKCSAGVCGGGVPANEGQSCIAPSACITNAKCTMGTCTGMPVTACIDNDACCPAGCTPATDNDCNCALDLALSAVGSTSGGGAPTCCGPDKMNDGVGKSNCNQFSWISNSDVPSNAYWELDWPSPVTIGSIYVEAENAAGTMPCSLTSGRNIASAVVQTWNGATWVTATSFTGQSGDVQINLPLPVLTNKIRLFNVTSSAGNGNSIMFEWHVFPGVSCIPPPD